MKNRTLALSHTRTLARLLACGAFTLTACGDPKLKVGINAGPAGADIGNMAASEVRQSGAAKDRWFEVRVAAQRAMSSNTLTSSMLTAALDSLAEDEKVAYVVSRFMSYETLEAAKRYNQQNVPWLSVSPLPPGLTNANGPGFALVPGLRKQAAVLAGEALARDRVAIVHIDDAYGKNLTAELKAILEANRLPIVDIRSYAQNWDEPRMVALGTEIDKSNPTLLYFIGRAPSLELVWQPFREAGRDLRVIGSDLVEATALFQNLGGRFTGLKFVRFFDPQSSDPRMQNLSERYDWWTSRGKMTGESVMVYDAMLLAGEALRSGARTREEFRQFFASLGRSRPPFNGVSGPIAFGDDGEIVRPFLFAEVTDGGVVAAK